VKYKKNGLEGNIGFRFTMSPLTILSYGLLRFFKKNLYLTKEFLKEKNEKGPKGILPPGAYRMGIFWKFHFINPPEVRRQVVKLLIYR
jgi:hypothetical protein